MKVHTVEEVARETRNAEANATPTVVRYSKYKIQIACQKRNLWEQVKEAIAAAGLSDSWANIQDIASGNPEFVAALPGIRQSFGTELVDDVLSESIAEAI